MVVVVGVAAAVYFLLHSLDAIVERAIEHYGSEVTGTAVRVASAPVPASVGTAILGMALFLTRSHPW